jgi:hypothetical protein
MRASRWDARWHDRSCVAGPPARLREAGYPAVDADDELPGLRRFHTEDVHGNRLEFLAPVG